MLLSACSKRLQQFCVALEIDRRSRHTVIAETSFISISSNKRMLLDMPNTHRTSTAPRFMAEMCLTPKSTISAKAICVSSATSQFWHADRFRCCSVSFMMIPPSPVSSISSIDYKKFPLGKFKSISHRDLIEFSPSSGLIEKFTLQSDF